MLTIAKAAVICRIISDASKFGMVAPVKFADFRDATVITAGEVPAKYQTMENVITV